MDFLRLENVHVGSWVMVSRGTRPVRAKAKPPLLYDVRQICPRLIPLSRSLRKTQGHDSANPEFDTLLDIDLPEKDDR